MQKHTRANTNKHTHTLVIVSVIVIIFARVVRYSSRVDAAQKKVGQWVAIQL